MKSSRPRNFDQFFSQIPDKCSSFVPIFIIVRSFLKFFENVARKTCSNDLKKESFLRFHWVHEATNFIPRREIYYSSNSYPLSAERGKIRVGEKRLSGSKEIFDREWRNGAERGAFGGALG